MRDMLRTRSVVSIHINLTPILTSYFIFLAAKEMGRAIISKAICEHLDEIKEYCSKDEKDAEE